MALLAAKTPPPLPATKRLPYSLVVLRGSSNLKSIINSVAVPKHGAPKHSDSDSAMESSHTTAEDTDRTVSADDGSSFDGSFTSENCSTTDFSDIDSLCGSDSNREHALYGCGRGAGAEGRKDAVSDVADKLRDAHIAGTKFKSENRKGLSTYQIGKLQGILNSKYTVHGMAPYPNLVIRPGELVTDIRDRLKASSSIKLRDVRLNGGAASYVVGCVEPGQTQQQQPYRRPSPYNDLDILFMVDFDDGTDTTQHFDTIRNVVLESLTKWYMRQTSSTPVSPMSLQGAYVSKLFRVPPYHVTSGSQSNGDCWSLISLRNFHGRNIELKFVKRIRRNFEFSVDSFQVILDPLISTETNGVESDAKGHNDVNVYVESAYGSVEEALEHMRMGLIYTRTPEELRGGGLLKYCSLLAHGLRLPLSMPARDRDILLAIMCNRFLIDFGATPHRLKGTLLNYINTHMPSPTAAFHYLRCVHDVMSAALGAHYSELLACVGDLMSSCAVRVGCNQMAIMQAHYIATQAYQAAFAAQLDLSGKLPYGRNQNDRGNSWNILPPELLDAQYEQRYDEHELLNAANMPLFDPSGCFSMA